MNVMFDLLEKIACWMAERCFNLLAKRRFCELVYILV